MHTYAYIRKLVAIAVVAASALSCRTNVEVPPSAATEAVDYKPLLSILDEELHKREAYIAAREAEIDSLRQLRTLATPEEQLRLTAAIAERYRGFLADSTLVECNRGEAMARDLGDSDMELHMRLERIQQMPLLGFSHEAVTEFESLPLDSMDASDVAMALWAGRQMYSYVAAQFPHVPDEQAHWNAHATALQERLVDMLEPDSPDMLLNLGECEFMKGNDTRAYAILTELFERVDRNTNRGARVAALIGQVAMRQGRVDESIYYLALSAITDVRSATREVTSLQQLGIALHDRADDMARADFYLQEALASAVECHASMRMLQTSEAIPVISAAARDATRRNSRLLYSAMGLMGLLTIILVGLVMKLRREMRRQQTLRHNLELTNHAKEVYMSEFISLCTVYMNKLNRFCEIAARKISTGGTDELYRLVRSGRFAEEQSRDFYATFDSAFLHIYPDFVAKVNALLRPDSQIELAPEEKLNTDLRILAFIRLGVEDSHKIAQALNYSVNTIYAYRNRLRNRALDRETFDTDILSIV